MIFRESTPADLPAIIDLLRTSLGEGSTEKSAAFWRWKHEANPFGASPVLLADDGGRIAGVRAFMRWEWQSRERNYRALRAVDTATHPDYRGQGIFKRLTLQLIEDRKAAGDDFIFNTPNEQSRPGYLKMGWKQVGKLPVRMGLTRPLRALGHLVGSSGGDKQLDLGRPDYSALGATGPLNWLRDPHLIPHRGWWTPPSVAFLRWRYAECPARTYHLVGDPDNFLIFYYAREQRIGAELRIVDYLVRPGAEGAARGALNDLRDDLRPDVMTVAPMTGLPWYFLPSLPIGLILTFRELNVHAAPEIADWRYSIGDLELF